MSVKRNVTVPDGRSAFVGVFATIGCRFRFNLVLESLVQTSSNLLSGSPIWLDLIVFTPTTGSPFSTGTVLEQTMYQRAQPPRTGSRFRARGFFGRCWGIKK